MSRSKYDGNANLGFESLAIHAGEPHPAVENAHITPIFQSSTYSFPCAKEGAETFAGKRPGYVYHRIGNPNMDVIEHKIALLEGHRLIAERRAAGDEEFDVVGVSFASGMAAIASLIFAILKPGDTLIAQSCLYGGTVELFNKTLTDYDINVVWITDDSIDHFAEALNENPQAKAVFAETPANPMLTIIDIEALAGLAREKNIPLIVDNTFATPYLQRPLELGADYVVHSMTKYIGGHGTVVGGIVVSPHRNMMMEQVLGTRHHVGGNPAPFDSWLLDMGVKTLPLRMERHCDNAEKIVNYLVQHSKVARVFYPGLPEDPGHEVAKKQMQRFGGMVSFELKGGYQAGETLMDNVRLMTLAVSLGNVDTLIEHPASLTHTHVPRELREKTGITDGLVRVSVGLESIDDLIADFDQALDKV